jgi:hypothetical protein
MPTITRWFRVTHDINSDPEMWELRELYGDRAGFIWLECLSIGDRNSGVVGPVSDHTRNALASKCRTPRTKVQQVLDWCRARAWLMSDTHWRIAKWKKYNKTRDVTESPSETTPRHDSPDRPIKIPLKRKTTTSYPENLEISESLKEWCVKEGVADPQPYLEAFRDYHVSKGSRFVDWVAAFRNWIRNRNRFGPPRLVQSNDELSERTQRILKRGL